MGMGPAAAAFWAGAILLLAFAAAPPQSANTTLTAVPGVKVGHHTLAGRPTDCTVILTEAGATAGVDVRGSAPATRETDLLNPMNIVQQVHAIVLSGESAFGLDSASGVMKYLEEKQIGFKFGAAHVPIVPAAALFDLGIGDPTIRPTADCGYQAAKAATDAPVAEGSVGAGVRTPDGNGLADARVLLRSGTGPRGGRGGENTTLGVIATNATLTKTQATRVAQMAYDGFARAISPSHTPNDGDAIFAIATGTKTGDADWGRIGELAAEVMADAIVRAARRATGIPGYPAARDLHR